ncbi:cobalamin biosynthesis protein CobD [Thalassotalea insulae]|uniref:Cobalamin biosynthesis protein CobD n=1 Tax=Thalassotalea insulae TaxID=2056778 RepID=A0ABQ6GYD9_9GAMM|nr:CobD/CbiB family cobalamin biosynthesis protein [Thalassotalea insulae]GLX79760.1 cobalamin biosynthesis protein CobD [Thalassotalea insulae]
MDGLITLSEQLWAVLPTFSTSLTILLALLLDKRLGEAKHYHYLVAFGTLANVIEAKLNPDHHIVAAKNVLPTQLKVKVVGLISWCLLVMPIPLLYFYLLSNLNWYWQLLCDATILYLALGLNSLHQHAMQIYRPLANNDIASARHFTGYIVSRDTNKLSEQEIARATVESMLENGHDAVIASLVCYLIGGAPLVIIHRLANTLDAMWGYKTPRYLHFGYASAKLDDLLGFISGKICTVLYAMQGNLKQALSNAYQQGNSYKSHNGGWVMAAGATVLKRQLGGTANYHGQQLNSVTLGQGRPVQAQDIKASLTIVTNASMLLVITTFIYQLTILIFHYY